MALNFYYKIRKLDTKVNVCFLTASEMYYEEIRKEVFPELEANCFIRKPITNEDLVKSVNILEYTRNSIVLLYLDGIGDT